MHTYTITNYEHHNKRESFHLKMKRTEKYIDCCVFSRQMSHHPLDYK